jgi:predicted DNA-binding transcriptional regulator AlpA
LSRAGAFKEEGRLPAYVSCERLAHELDCSETTVHELVKRGVLPQPVRLSNGTVRWRWSAVEAALRSLEQGGDRTASADPFMVGLENV